MLVWLIKGDVRGMKMVICWVARR